MNVHPRIVDRIAREYFRRYREIGMEAAGDYAEVVIGNNPPLQDAVRDKVNELARELVNGPKK